jgi:hypothetical protein
MSRPGWPTCAGGGDEGKAVGKGDVMLVALSGHGSQMRVPEPPPRLRVVLFDPAVRRAREPEAALAEPRACQAARVEVGHQPAVARLFVHQVGNREGHFGPPREELGRLRRSAPITAHEPCTNSEGNSCSYAIARVESDATV